MILKYSDIMKCPKHSLAAQHYNADGSCCCSELPAVRERLSELRKIRKDAQAEIRRLEAKF